MDGLTERLLAMARGASHEQQDYLEVIERVLDQRQVDFDALAAEALDHFLESGLDRDIGLVGVATAFWLQNQDSERAAMNSAELLASLAAMGLPSALYNIAVLQSRQGVNLTEATQVGSRGVPFARRRTGPAGPGTRSARGQPCRWTRLPPGPGPRVCLLRGSGSTRQPGCDVCVGCLPARQGRAVARRPRPGPGGRSLLPGDVAWCGPGPDQPGLPARCRTDPRRGSRAWTVLAQAVGGRGRHGGARRAAGARAGRARRGAQTTGYLAVMTGTPARTPDGQRTGTSASGSSCA
jgi:hypothetical protein